MNLLVGHYKDYPILISNKPEKKYMAIVKGKKVYFGQIGYGHYHDIFGFYKDLDTNDKTRRDLYYKRHPKNYKLGSADHFAKAILWPLDV